MHRLDGEEKYTCVGSEAEATTDGAECINKVPIQS